MKKRVFNVLIPDYKMGMEKSLECCSFYMGQNGKNEDGKES